MEPHTGLNNLDFVVLGIVLLSGILAMFRGFVREVLGLAGWTVAYFAAVKYYPLLEPWAHSHIKSEKGAAFAAGLCIFLIILLLCALATNLIVGLVRGKALNAIDRSLGFGFGLLRGGLVVCIVYLAVTSFMWPDIDKPPAEQAKNTTAPPDWIMEAHTRPSMAKGAAILRTFVPEKDIKSVASEFDEQKNNAQKMVDEKKLEMLSVPVPGNNKDAPSKEGSGPAYDAESRSNLDKQINQKSAP